MLVVCWLLVYVIDHQHGHRALLLLQSQPELSGKGVEEGERAAWVRCRGCVARWLNRGSAPASTLERAGRAEIEGKVPCAVDARGIQNRRANVPRRNARKLF